MRQISGKRAGADGDSTAGEPGEEKEEDGTQMVLSVVRVCVRALSARRGHGLSLVVDVSMGRRWFVGVDTFATDIRQEGGRGRRQHCRRTWGRKRGNGTRITLECVRVGVFSQKGTRPFPCGRCKHGKKMVRRCEQMCDRYPARGREGDSTAGEPGEENEGSGTKHFGRSEQVRVRALSFLRAEKETRDFPLCCGGEHHINRQR